MRTCLVFTLMLFLSLTFASAQKISFDDFSKEVLTTSGVIKNGTEVAGYYMVNRTDEGRGRKRVLTYTLKILDHNLELIGTKIFENNTDVLVSSVAYNGVNLAVRFVDAKNERVWVEVVDGTGTTVNTVEFEYDFWFDKPEMAEMAQSYGYFPLQITEGGFLHYKFFFEKGILGPINYNIQYIPNAKDVQGWGINSGGESSPKTNMASYLGSNDEILINSIMTAERRTAGFKSIIQAVDKSIGEVIFEFEMDQLPPAIITGNVKLGDENIEIYGLYGNDVISISAGAFTGIAKITIDYSGKLIDEMYLPINDAIQEQLNIEIDENHQFGGIGKLIFHGMEFGSQNDIIATFEGCLKHPKKNSVYVLDAVVVHLDVDFSNPKVLRIEKPEKLIEFSNTNAAALVAAPVYLKMIGGYDFKYQTNFDDEVNVFFLSKERITEEENWTIIHAKLIGDDLSTETVPISPSCDFAKILPARNGYVMIMEYFGEEKRLDTRLERLKI